ncbi:hypothetical protein OIU74_013020 [Salix koriyanagi]|uniref:Uncharacterized protein n=1 Tax=Salix koriyanagi TaxID=2511006 RepID=A0A9Q0Q8G0_9ROSI|nr:hypothetical protein OIU74_013020 [Salix koriyanagi]
MSNQMHRRLCARLTYHHMGLTLPRRTHRIVVRLRRSRSPTIITELKARTPETLLLIVHLQKSSQCQEGIHLSGIYLEISDASFSKLCLPLLKGM